MRSDCAGSEKIRPPRRDRTGPVCGVVGRVLWTRRSVLVVCLLLATGARLPGFVLVSDKWPDGTIPMQLQLVGPTSALTDGSRDWNESAESALAAWNKTIARVQFTIVRDSSAPKGDGNGVNNVFFSNDIYGMAFGSGVLAVTTNWARRQTRTEGDVIFNNGLTWDSYSGTLRRSVQDFHRVALHEFGHVLGLDHPDENGQTVSAIMNSHIGNLDQLSSDDVEGAQALYDAPAPPPPPVPPVVPPTIPPNVGGTVSFPPRNESLDFRNQLEGKYRDSLKRAPLSTYVDAEGDIVWTQEYERYRVNLCAHGDAVSRVLTQIDGSASPAVCGAATPGQVAFPARNEALDFRNQLEAKYRDGLKRLPTSTTVDNEGDIVWIQEYLRYRVNGCGHAIAVQNVFTQIDGLPAAPVCR